MADPTLPSEEVLNELEAAVRAELAAHPEEYTEEAGIMLSLIAAARAVRRVERLAEAGADAPMHSPAWYLSTQVKAALTGAKP